MTANPVTFKRDHDGFVVVDTDGSCTNNGASNAEAGFGVFWGTVGHPFNIHDKVPTQDAQTSPRAELWAALNALDRAQWADLRHVKVRTDSEYVVKSMNEWAEGWEKHGWYRLTGPVANQDLIMWLYNLTFDTKAVFEYVVAHSGDPGNEMADKMANEGRKLHALPEEEYRRLHVSPYFQC